MRPTPSSRPPCARPIRRCCTTGPAASTWPAPVRCRATTASTTCCSGCWRRSTSRSPAAATRCSATPRWPSSRRRRRSPRTCRGRWAWRSPSVAPPASGWRPGGRSTPSPWPASATPRSTTRRPRARSTPPPTPPTRACRCRCCSCARTTGGASACRPRPGGSRRRSAGRPGLRYERVDGTDPVGVHDVAEELADHVRATGRPAVLHLRTVRYGGHAGTDVEAAYRTVAGIRADLARDPLLATAGVLVEAGHHDAGGDRRPLPRRPRGTCATRPTSCAPRPRLRTAAEVVAPLAPHRPAAVADAAPPSPRPPSARAAFFGRLPEDEGPLTLAESINRTLGDLLCGDERVLVFGEDVGVKGGVYGVTRGPAAQGRAAAGVRHPARRAVDPRPRPRRRACPASCRSPRSSTSPTSTTPRTSCAARRPACAFFSNGQYTNPLVVRIAGYGYQKGFGGHFHNDNGVGRAARHPRPRDRLAGPPGRRPGDAAHVRRGGRRRRHGQRVPRADRALPHPRPARAGRRGLDGAVRRRRRRGPASTSRSACRRSFATATTCSS